MSRGPHPILLILAWVLPTTAGALGLGDIHVDSALNEPLSAQIEIVGASLDDLTDLRAAVANLDTFHRYGAERPAFLNSATFKIGRDAQGRPVLNVQSRDSFTDPMVSFLIDLRWRNSELVREYSLLLDPAGLSAARRAVTDSAALAKVAAVAPPAQLALASAPPADYTPATDVSAHHRITARDTLRVIVRRAGARSESQIQRMMIATFRANPNAFEGNINRLHRGAVLDLPTPAGLAAISAAAAKQEVAAQMIAWRSSGRGGNSVQHPSAPASDLAAAAIRSVSRDQNEAALSDRVQTLEQQLGDLHRQMTHELANLQELKQAGIRVPETAPAAAPVPQTTSSTAPKHLNLVLGLATLLLASALAVYGYLRRRLQRPLQSDPLQTTVVEASEVVMSPSTLAVESATLVNAEAPPALPTADPSPRHSSSTNTPQWPPVAARNEATGIAIEVDAEALELSYLESLGFNKSTFGESAAQTGKFQFAAASPSATETLESIAPPNGGTAVTAEIDMSEIEEMEMEIDATEVNTAVLKPQATTLVVAVTATAAVTGVSGDLDHSMTTELDFNLSNLDATAEHVQMPSALNDHVETTEARTNIVDVLKVAIDRDPHRRDLRMKLLETYYNAATGNRRSFLEVVRKLARERESLSPEEWSKIVRMGRDLAPDDILFTDLVKDEDDVAA